MELYSKHLQKHLKFPPPPPPTPHPYGRLPSQQVRQPCVHSPSCRETGNVTNLTHSCACSISWKGPSGCIQLSEGMILSEKTLCAEGGANEHRGLRDFHLAPTGSSTGSGSTIFLRTRRNLGGRRGATSTHDLECGQNRYRVLEPNAWS